MSHAGVAHRGLHRRHAIDGLHPDLRRGLAGSMTARSRFLGHSRVRMLIQPICASTATEPVNRERVGVILKEARLRNELRVLTGTLVFDPQCVLQVLEGER